MNNINIIATIIIISILILLSSHLFIHKTFHTEVTIPVQPEALWNALMDEAQYAKWNTVLVPIEGRIEEGKKLKYEMTDQNNKKSIIRIKVKRALVNQELNQVGGVPGILTFDHKYILEPTETGTKLIQHEIDRGLWLLFWDSSWIEDAYIKTSKNLGSFLTTKNKDAE
ncbi:MAG: SRPBCC domain-containing protein [Candidatus Marinamargulisbacteria bacterium]